MANGRKKNITIRFVFSGPANRSQCEDAEEWREIKAERDEEAGQVEVGLKKYNAKVSAHADTLTVKFKGQKSDVSRVVRKVIGIVDYYLAPDDPEVEIK